MKNEDMIMDSATYLDWLLGGLNDEEESRAEVEEMRAAKVGTVKADCWKKIEEDKYIIYVV